MARATILLTGTTQDNVITSGVAQPFTATGTYAIGSNGSGYIYEPVFSLTGSVYLSNGVRRTIPTHIFSWSCLAGRVHGKFD